MQIERTFLQVLNILARLFGVLFVTVGIAFLVSAYAIKENRALDTVLGLWIVAMGVALLLAKAVGPAQLARMKRLMGRSE